MSSNPIQEMIDRRTGREVFVPTGEYVGDVVVPKGVRLVFERGVTLKGSVTVHGDASFEAGGMLFSCDSVSHEEERYRWAS